MTNIKIVSLVSKILTITTAAIAIPLLLLGSLHASVDHLMDYHLELPSWDEDRQQAEKESKEDGYSTYQDVCGETHHFINGQEIN